MNFQEQQKLVARYPKVNDLIALGNENREHSPTIARLCDSVAELVVDLMEHGQFDPPEPPPQLAPAVMAASAGVSIDLVEFVRTQNEKVAALMAQMESLSRQAASGALNVNSPSLPQQSDTSDG